MSEAERKAQKAIGEARAKLELQTANAIAARDKRRETYPTNPDPEKTVERANRKCEKTIADARTKYEKTIADTNKKFKK